MDITFQNTTGKRYAATLTDDRLSDIRLLENSPSSVKAPMRGGSFEESMEHLKQALKQSLETTDETQEKPTKPEPLSAADRTFVERLRAVLRNNRARKQLRHKQRGILDQRALVKVETDSQSVWRQHNRKESHRDYSILLLVDESGSMQGRKATLCEEITTATVRNLESVDGVQCAVLGFAGNRIVEHKRFDNSGTTSLDAIDPYSKTTQSMRQIDGVKKSDHENADLIAIDYALKYLTDKADPRSRLVMVMLSDGKPCASDTTISVVTADMQGITYRSPHVTKVVNTAGYGRTEEIDLMHQLVKHYPQVNCFGLGMLMGGQQIPNHRIVKDLGETKGVLLHFLQTVVQ